RSPEDSSKRVELHRPIKRSYRKEILEVVEHLAPHSQTYKDDDTSNDSKRQTNLFRKHSKFDKFISSFGNSEIWANSRNTFSRIIHNDDSVDQSYPILYPTFDTAGDYLADGTGYYKDGFTNAYLSKFLGETETGPPYTSKDIKDSLKNYTEFIPQFERIPTSRVSRIFVNLRPRIKEPAVYEYYKKNIILNTNDVKKSPAKRYYIQKSIDVIHSERQNSPEYKTFIYNSPVPMPPAISLEQTENDPKLSTKRMTNANMISKALDKKTNYVLDLNSGIDKQHNENNLKFREFSEGNGMRSIIPNTPKAHKTNVVHDANNNVLSKKSYKEFKTLFNIHQLTTERSIREDNYDYFSKDKTSLLPLILNTQGSKIPFDENQTPQSLKNKNIEENRITSIQNRDFHLSGLAGLVITNESMFGENGDILDAEIKSIIKVLEELDKEISKKPTSKPFDRPEDDFQELGKIKVIQSKNNALGRDIKFQAPQKSLRNSLVNSKSMEFDLNLHRQFETFPLKPEITNMGKSQPSAEYTILRPPKDEQHLFNEDRTKPNEIAYNQQGKFNTDRIRNFNMNPLTSEDFYHSVQRTSENNKNINHAFRPIPVNPSMFVQMRTVDSIPVNILPRHKHRDHNVEKATINTQSLFSPSATKNVTMASTIMNRIKSPQLNHRLEIILPEKDPGGFIEDKNEKIFTKTSGVFPNFASVNIQPQHTNLNIHTQEENQNRPSRTPFIPAHGRRENQIPIRSIPEDRVRAAGVQKYSRKYDFLVDIPTSKYNDIQFRIPTEKPSQKFRRRHITLQLRTGEDNKSKNVFNGFDHSIPPFKVQTSHQKNNLPVSQPVYDTPSKRFYSSPFSSFSLIKQKYLPNVPNILIDNASNTLSIKSPLHQVPSLKENKLSPNEYIDKDTLSLNENKPVEINNKFHWRNSMKDHHKTKMLPSFHTVPSWKGDKVIHERPRTQHGITKLHTPHSPYIDVRTIDVMGQNHTPHKTVPAEVNINNLPIINKDDQPALKSTEFKNIKINSPRDSQLRSLLNKRHWKPFTEDRVIVPKNLLQIGSQISFVSSPLNKTWNIKALNDGNKNITVPSSTSNLVNPAAVQEVKIDELPIKHSYKLFTTRTFTPKREFDLPSSKVRHMTMVDSNFPSHSVKEKQIINTNEGREYKPVGSGIKTQDQISLPYEQQRTMLKERDFHIARNAPEIISPMKSTYKFIPNAVTISPVSNKIISPITSTFKNEVLKGYLERQKAPLNKGGTLFRNDEYKTIVTEPKFVEKSETIRSSLNLPQILETNFPNMNDRCKIVYVVSSPIQIDEEFPSVGKKRYSITKIIECEEEKLPPIPGYEQPTLSMKNLNIVTYKPTPFIKIVPITNANQKTVFQKQQNRFQPLSIINPLDGTRVKSNEIRILPLPTRIPKFVYITPSERNPPIREQKQSKSSVTKDYGIHSKGISDRNNKPREIREELKPTLITKGNRHSKKQSVEATLPIESHLKQKLSGISFTPIQKYVKPEVRSFDTPSDIKYDILPEIKISPLKHNFKLYRTVDVHPSSEPISSDGTTFPSVSRKKFSEHIPTNIIPVIYRKYTETNGNLIPNERVLKTKINVMPVDTQYKESKLPLSLEFRTSSQKMQTYTTPKIHIILEKLRGATDIRPYNHREMKRPPSPDKHETAYGINFNIREVKYGLPYVNSHQNDQQIISKATIPPHTDGSIPVVYRSAIESSTLTSPTISKHSLYLRTHVPEVQLPRTPVEVSADKPSTFDKVLSITESSFPRSSKITTEGLFDYHNSSGKSLPFHIFIQKGTSIPRVLQEKLRSYVIPQITDKYIEPYTKMTTSTASDNHISKRFYTNFRTEKFVHTHPKAIYGTESYESSGTTHSTVGLIIKPSQKLKFRYLKADLSNPPIQKTVTSNIPVNLLVPLKTSTSNEHPEYFTRHSVIKPRINENHRKVLYPHKIIHLMPARNYGRAAESKITEHVHDLLKTFESSTQITEKKVIVPTLNNFGHFRLNTHLIPQRNTELSNQRPTSRILPELLQPKPSAEYSYMTTVTPDKEFKLSVRQALIRQFTPKLQGTVGTMLPAQITPSTRNVINHAIKGIHIRRKISDITPKLLYADLLSTEHSVLKDTSSTMTTNYSQTTMYEKLYKGIPKENNLEIKVSAPQTLENKLNRKPQPRADEIIESSKRNKFTIYSRNGGLNELTTKASLIELNTLSELPQYGYDSNRLKTTWQLAQFVDGVPKLLTLGQVSNYRSTAETSDHTENSTKFAAAQYIPNISHPTEIPKLRTSALEFQYLKEKNQTPTIKQSFTLGTAKRYINYQNTTQRRPKLVKSSLVPKIHSKVISSTESLQYHSQQLKPVSLKHLSSTQEPLDKIIQEVFAPLRMESTVKQNPTMLYSKFQPKLRTSTRKKSSLEIEMSAKHIRTRNRKLIQQTPHYSILYKGYDITSPRPFTYEKESNNERRYTTKPKITVKLKNKFPLQKNMHIHFTKPTTKQGTAHNEMKEIKSASHTSRYKIPLFVSTNQAANMRHVIAQDSKQISQATPFQIPTIHFKTEIIPRNANMVPYTLSIRLKSMPISLTLKNISNNIQQEVPIFSKVPTHTTITPPVSKTSLHQRSEKILGHNANNGNHIPVEGLIKGKVHYTQRYKLPYSSTNSYSKHKVLPYERRFTTVARNTTVLNMQPSFQGIIPYAAMPNVTRGYLGRHKSIQKLATSPAHTQANIATFATTRSTRSQSSEKVDNLFLVERPNRYHSPEKSATEAPQISSTVPMTFKITIAPTSSSENPRYHIPQHIMQEPNFPHLVSHPHPTTQSVFNILLEKVFQPQINFTNIMDTLNKLHTKIQTNSQALSLKLLPQVPKLISHQRAEVQTVEPDAKGTTIYNTAFQTVARTAPCNNRIGEISTREYSFNIPTSNPLVGKTRRLNVQNPSQGLIETSTARLKSSEMLEVNDIMKQTLAIPLPSDYEVNLHIKPQQSKLKQITRQNLTKTQNTEIPTRKKVNLVYQHTKYPDGQYNLSSLPLVHIETRYVTTPTLPEEQRITPALMPRIQQPIIRLPETVGHTVENKPIFPDSQFLKYDVPLFSSTTTTSIKHRDRSIFPKQKSDLFSYLNHNKNSFKDKTTTELPRQTSSRNPINFQSTTILSKVITQSYPSHRQITGLRTTYKRGPNTDLTTKAELDRYIEEIFGTTFKYQESTTRSSMQPKQQILHPHILLLTTDNSISQSKQKTSSYTLSSPLIIFSPSSKEKMKDIQNERFTTMQSISSNMIKTTMFPRMEAEFSTEFTNFQPSQISGQKIFNTPKKQAIQDSLYQPNNIDSINKRSSIKNKILIPVDERKIFIVGNIRNTVIPVNIVTTKPKYPFAKVVLTTVKPQIIPSITSRRYNDYKPAEYKVSSIGISGKSLQHNILIPKIQSKTSTYFPENAGGSPFQSHSTTRYSVSDVQTRVSNEYKPKSHDSSKVNVYSKTISSKGENIRKHSFTQPKVIVTTEYTSDHTRTIGNENAIPKSTVSQFGTARQGIELNRNFPGRTIYLEGILKHDSKPIFSIRNTVIPNDRIYEITTNLNTHSKEQQKILKPIDRRTESTGNAEISHESTHIPDVKVLPTFRYPYSEVGIPIPIQQGNNRSQSTTKIYRATANDAPSLTAVHSSIQPIHLSTRKMMDVHSPMNIFRPVSKLNQFVTGTHRYSSPIPKDFTTIGEKKNSGISPDSLENFKLPSDTMTYIPGQTKDQIATKLETNFTSPKKIEAIFKLGETDVPNKLPSQNKTTKYGDQEEKTDSFPSTFAHPKPTVTIYSSELSNKPIKAVNESALTSPRNIAIHSSKLNEIIIPVKYQFAVPRSISPEKETESSPYKKQNEVITIATNIPAQRPKVLTLKQQRIKNVYFPGFTYEPLRNSNTKSRYIHPKSIIIPLIEGEMKTILFRGSTMKIASIQSGLPTTTRKYTFEEKTPIIYRQSKIFDSLSSNDRSKYNPNEITLMPLQNKYPIIYKPKKIGTTINIYSSHDPKSRTGKQIEMRPIISLRTAADHTMKAYEVPIISNKYPSTETISLTSSKEIITSPEFQKTMKFGVTTSTMKTIFSSSEFNIVETSEHPFHRPLFVRNSEGVISVPHKLPNNRNRHSSLGIINLTTMAQKTVSMPKQLYFSTMKYSTPEYKITLPITQETKPRLSFPINDPNYVRSSSSVKPNMLLPNDIKSTSSRSPKSKQESETKILKMDTVTSSYLSPEPYISSMMINNMMTPDSLKSPDGLLSMSDEVTTGPKKFNSKNSQSQLSIGRITTKVSLPKITDYRIFELSTIPKNIPRFPITTGLKLEPRIALASTDEDVFTQNEVPATANWYSQPQPRFEILRKLHILNSNRTDYPVSKPTVMYANRRKYLFRGPKILTANGDEMKSAQSKVVIEDQWHIPTTIKSTHSSYDNKILTTERYVTSPSLLRKVGSSVTATTDIRSKTGRYPFKIMNDAVPSVQEIKLEVVHPGKHKPRNEISVSSFTEGLRNVDKGVPITTSKTVSNIEAKPIMHSLQRLKTKSNTPLLMPQVNTKSTGTTKQFPLDHQSLTAIKYVKIKKSTQSTTAPIEISHPTESAINLSSVYKSVEHTTERGWLDRVHHSALPGDIYKRFVKFDEEQSIPKGKQYFSRDVKTTIPKTVSKISENILPLVRKKSIHRVDSGNKVFGKEGLPEILTRRLAGMRTLPKPPNFIIGALRLQPRIHSIKVGQSTEVIINTNSELFTPSPQRRTTRVNMHIEPNVTQNRIWADYDDSKIIKQHRKLYVTQTTKIPDSNTSDNLQNSNIEFMKILQPKDSNRTRNKIYPAGEHYNQKIKLPVHINMTQMTQNKTKIPINNTIAYKQRETHLNLTQPQGSQIKAIIPSLEPYKKLGMRIQYLKTPIIQTNRPEIVQRKLKIIANRLEKHLDVSSIKFDHLKRHSFSESSPQETFTENTLRFSTQKISRINLLETPLYNLTLYSQEINRLVDDSINSQKYIKRGVRISTVPTFTTMDSKNTNIKQVSTLPMKLKRITEIWNNMRTLTNQSPKILEANDPDTSVPKFNKNSQSVPRNYISYNLTTGSRNATIMKLPEKNNAQPKISQENRLFKSTSGMSITLSPDLYTRMPMHLNGVNIEYQSTQKYSKYTGTDHGKLIYKTEPVNEIPTTIQPTVPHTYQKSKHNFVSKQQAENLKPVEFDHGEKNHSRRISSEEIDDNMTTKSYLKLKPQGHDEKNIIKFPIFQYANDRRMLTGNTEKVTYNVPKETIGISRKVTGISEQNHGIPDLTLQRPFHMNLLPLSRVNSANNLSATTAKSRNIYKVEPRFRNTMEHTPFIIKIIHNTTDKSEVTENKQTVYRLPKYISYLTEKPQKYMNLVDLPKSTNSNAHINPYKPNSSSNSKNKYKNSPPLPVFHFPNTLIAHTKTNHAKTISLLNKEEPTKIRQVVKSPLTIPQKHDKNIGNKLVKPDIKFPHTGDHKVENKRSESKLAMRYDGKVRNTLAQPVSRILFKPLGIDIHNKAFIPTFNVWKPLHGSVPKQTIPHTSPQYENLGKKASKFMIQVPFDTTPRTINIINKETIPKFNINSSFGGNVRKDPSKPIYKSDLLRDRNLRMKEIGAGLRQPLMFLGKLPKKDTKVTFTEPQPINSNILKQGNKLAFINSDNFRNNVTRPAFTVKKLVYGKQVIKPISKPSVFVVENAHKATGLSLRISVPLDEVRSKRITGPIEHVYPDFYKDHKHLPSIPKVKPHYNKLQGYNPSFNNLKVSSKTANPSNFRDKPVYLELNDKVENVPFLRTIPASNNKSLESNSENQLLATKLSFDWSKTAVRTTENYNKLNSFSVPRFRLPIKTYPNRLLAYSDRHFPNKKFTKTNTTVSTAIAIKNNSILLESVPPEGHIRKAPVRPLKFYSKNEQISLSSRIGPHISDVLNNKVPFFKASELNKFYYPKNTVPEGPGLKYPKIDMPFKINIPINEKYLNKMIVPAEIFSGIPHGSLSSTTEITKPRDKVQFRHKISTEDKFDYSTTRTVDKQMILPYNPRYFGFNNVKNPSPKVGSLESHTETIRSRINARDPDNWSKTVMEPSKTDKFQDILLEYSPALSRRRNPNGPPIQPLTTQSTAVKKTTPNMKISKIERYFNISSPAHKIARPKPFQSLQTYSNISPPSPKIKYDYSNLFNRYMHSGLNYISPASKGKSYVPASSYYRKEPIKFELNRGNKASYDVRTIPDLRSGFNEMMLTTLTTTERYPEQINIPEVDDEVEDTHKVQEMETFDSPYRDMSGKESEVFKRREHGLVSVSKKAFKLLENPNNLISSVLKVITSKSSDLTKSKTISLELKDGVTKYNGSNTNTDLGISKQKSIEKFDHESVDTELTKVVKIGTAKIFGVIQQLGSMLGIGKIKLSGQVEGSGDVKVEKSVVKADGFKFKGSGAIEISKNKRVVRKFKAGFKSSSIQSHIPLKMNIDHTDHEVRWDLNTRSIISEPSQERYGEQTNARYLVHPRFNYYFHNMQPEAENVEYRYVYEK
ncbi:hypothetical protein C0J52_27716, partial [Blattella germanica]